jgi:putative peptidoglycan lipid II flippase
MVSSALGLVRELLITRQLGANQATDAYLVAVSVPVLMYALFFGSGLNVSLVPKLTVLLVNEREVGRKIFAQFLSGAALCSCAGTCLLLAIPGTFLRTFAPGMAESQIGAQFLCFLSPLVFLFVVSYTLGSFHCASGRLAQWGVIPVVQNACIVLALLVAGRVWGIRALLAGTLIGAFFSLLMQARAAHADGFHESWANPFRSAPGRNMLLGMLPFALVGGMGGDFGTSQVDIFLIRFFGSSLRPGSITLLTLGNKLMGLPVLLIGAALGLALLPSLSETLSRGDRAEAGRQFSQAWLYGLLLICPIAVIYFDLSAAIVRLVFRNTALGPGQLAELGQILRAYAGAVIGLVLVYVLNSFLAAQRRTRALITAGLLTIQCDVALMIAFRSRLGAPGIALAISLGSLVYCAVLLGLLMKDLPVSVRWSLLQRTGVILLGAASMHLGLTTVRAAVFRSLSGLNSALVSVLVGVTIYLAWIGFCRQRLQAANA